MSSEWNLWRYYALEIVPWRALLKLRVNGDLFLRLDSVKNDVWYDVVRTTNKIKYFDQIKIIFPSNSDVLCFGGVSSKVRPKFPRSFAWCCPKNCPCLCKSLRHHWLTNFQQISQKFLFLRFGSIKNLNMVDTRMF